MLPGNGAHAEAETAAVASARGHAELEIVRRPGRSPGREAADVLDLVEHRHVAVLLDEDAVDVRVGLVAEVPQLEPELDRFSGVRDAVAVAAALPGAVILDQEVLDADVLAEPERHIREVGLPVALRDGQLHRPRRRGNDQIDVPLRVGVADRLDLRRAGRIEADERAGARRGDTVVDVDGHKALPARQRGRVPDLQRERHSAPDLAGRIAHQVVPVDVADRVGRLGGVIVQEEVHLPPGVGGPHLPGVVDEHPAEGPVGVAVVEPRVRAGRRGPDAADAPLRVGRGPRAQEALAAGSAGVEGPGVASDDGAEGELPAVVERVGLAVPPAADAHDPAIREDGVAAVQRRRHLGDEGAVEDRVVLRVADLAQPVLHPPHGEDGAEAGVVRVADQTGAREPGRVVHVRIRLVVHHLGHDGLELGRVLEGEPPDVRVPEIVGAVELHVGMVAGSIVAADRLIKGRDAVAAVGIAGEDDPLGRIGPVEVRILDVRLDRGVRRSRLLGRGHVDGETLPLAPVDQGLQAGEDVRVVAADQQPHARSR